MAKKSSNAQLMKRLHKESAESRIAQLELIKVIMGALADFGNDIAKSMQKTKQKRRKS